RAAEPERLRGDVATWAEKTKGLRLSCSSCLHLAGLRHHRYHLSSTASSMASDHQFRDIMRWVTSQLTADGTAMVKEFNLSRWVSWARLSVHCCRISTMTHYTRRWWGRPATCSSPRLRRGAPSLSCRSWSNAAKRSCGRAG